MNLLKYYLEEAIRRVRRFYFLRTAIKILDTNPVVPANSGPLVLSMVQQKDVIPYLAALKSFVRFVDVCGVVVVSDKSLTPDDKKLIASQISGVVIRDAAEFARRDLPTGGCWERLIAISEYVQGNYVIQLDADTLSLGALDSVIEAYQANESFILSTFDLQSKVNVKEMSRWAQSHCTGDVHVQVLCEANLMAAAGGDLAKQYIRGCAGFSGFGKGSFAIQELVTLSERMSGILGEKWKKWGTEQFASNYIVSNSKNCIALPHPMYTTPEQINSTTVFVHFIGPLRYYRGRYLTYVKKLLER